MRLAVLVALVGSPAAASAAFRCPAPVPVVGDVRRAQVDRLFFSITAAARAADRLPVEADVDAALAAAGLTARLQPVGYRPLNELLYTVAPDGRPGLRIAFYTAETWGYALTQVGAIDATPAVVDSESTYRLIGGDLPSTLATYDLVRAWRLFGGALPTARALVAEARARGLNEGRVQELASASAAPRAGSVGIAVARDGSTATVRGRTCARIVTLQDADGVESRRVERRRARVAVCPADDRVPAELRRSVRAVFDRALAIALAAGRVAPVEADVVAALVATGIAASDVSATPTGGVPTGAVTYELGAGRFAVAIRVGSGGSYRVDWLGLDQPIVVTDRNDARDRALLALGWQLDRLVAAVGRPWRLPTARRFAALRVGGVTLPRRVLRTRQARAVEGTLGVFVAADRRSALLRGTVCGARALRYVRTRTGVPR